MTHFEFIYILHTLKLYLFLFGCLSFIFFVIFCPFLFLFNLFFQFNPDISIVGMVLIRMLWIQFILTIFMLSIAEALDYVKQVYVIIFYRFMYIFISNRQFFLSPSNDNYLLVVMSSFFSNYRIGHNYLKFQTHLKLMCQYNFKNK